MHPRGLLVLALLQAQSRALSNQLSCEPPTIGETGLKVAFHNSTLTDLCHLQPTPFSFRRMEAHCQAFCKMTDFSLALQLGAPPYGFSLAEMNSVCFETFEHNESLEAFCWSNKDSMVEIGAKTAQFVAAVNVFKAQQGVFRANTQKQSQDLQAELGSPAFRREMDRMVPESKLAFLKAKFRDFARATKQNSSGSPLHEAMEVMRTTFEELSESVRVNVAIFEDYVSQCNKLLLGAGSQKEYLLDICAVESVHCIEELRAAHVGCCCGFNPLVASAYDIAGLSSAFFEGGGFVGAGRRLQDAFEPDICAEVWKSSEGAVSKARDRMMQLGDGTALARRDRQLFQQYPLYFQQCSSRCPQEGGKEGKANASLANASLANASLAEHGPRRLQQLDCTPPRVEDLKVAFSQTLQEDTCSLQEPPMKYSDMAAQCGKFCSAQGRNSMAMLIGSETYGFNLAASKSICMGPEGALRHDPEQRERCGNWSTAFAGIESKTATFIASLNIFTATRQHYTVQLRKTAIALREFVGSNAFINEAKRRIHKVKWVRESIQQWLELQANGDLTRAIQDLKRSAKELMLTLNTNSELLQRFLSECNDLFLGVGAGGEFLLDICAQLNVACVEHELAGHVTCCCGQHPFTTFGDHEDFNEDTGNDDHEGKINGTAGGVANFSAGNDDHEGKINGTAGGVANFSAPAPAGGRRLEEEDRVLDICAAGWTKAAPAVWQLHQEILAAGGQDLLDERSARMRAAYGSDYCGYELHGGDAVSGAVSGEGGAVCQIKAEPSPSTDQAEPSSSTTSSTSSALTETSPPPSSRATTQEPPTEPSSPKLQGRLGCSTANCEQPSKNSTPASRAATTSSALAPRLSQRALAFLASAVIVSYAPDPA